MPWQRARFNGKDVWVEVDADGLRVAYRSEGDETPPDATFDRVLVAIGRRTNHEDVGLDALGVKVDERGIVATDAQQRTNVPHVFAIGDLTGPPQLAHRATHQGKVAAEVAAGHKSAFDARTVPAVAYTDPEVAWAGLTEEEAERDGIAVRKGEDELRQNLNAAIQAIRKDGTYKKINDKYFDFDVYGEATPAS